MKATFKGGVKGWSGYFDDVVYVYNPRLKKTMVREYVYPTLTENNERTTSIMANLKLLVPSVGYKNDLRDYVMYYNNCIEFREKPFNAWNNAWLKLMFALQKAMPETVDLKTITREQIYEQNLPCKTVKDAIEAGLLPVMPEYQRWDKLI
jgi:hypothetical protein